MNCRIKRPFLYVANYRIRIESISGFSNVEETEIKDGTKDVQAYRVAIFFDGTKLDLIFIDKKTAEEVYGFIERTLTEGV